MFKPVMYDAGLSQSFANVRARELVKGRWEDVRAPELECKPDCGCGLGKSMCKRRGLLDDDRAPETYSASLIASMYVCLSFANIGKLCHIVGL